MTFLLRAALAIGALSYLAMVRGQPGTPADGAGSFTAAVEGALRPAIERAPPGAAPAATIAGLSAAWDAMPSDARRRLAHEAVAELGRRLPPEPAPSRDTLADADRKAAWRGGEAR